MRTDECSNCGAPAEVVRADYDFSAEAGLTVVLEGIDVVQCKKCGNVDPIIPKLGPLMRVLAKALIEKRYPLTGPEVRFLRKHLGKSGDDFAKLLHVDRTVLSRWENGANAIGDQSDRLIRLIAAGKIETFKKDEIAWTIDHFLEISDENGPSSLVIDPQRMSYRYVA